MMFQCLAATSLSWMPEQVNYLHDAAYWRALLGRCQGAEVLQVREMESHEEFWADWLRQDNEYAIGDRKAMEAGGIWTSSPWCCGRSKRQQGPRSEWLRGPCRLGGR